MLKCLKLNISIDLKKGDNVEMFKVHTYYFQIPTISFLIYFLRFKIIPILIVYILIVYSSRA